MIIMSSNIAAALQTDCRDGPSSGDEMSSLARTSSAKSLPKSRGGTWVRRRDPYPPAARPIGSPKQTSVRAKESIWS
jgi:hypothetical protein